MAAQKPSFGDVVAHLRAIADRYDTSSIVVNDDARGALRGVLLGAADKDILRHCASAIENVQLALVHWDAAEHSNECSRGNDDDCYACQMIINLVECAGLV